MLKLTHNTTTLANAYVASNGVCWKIKGLYFTREFTLKYSYSFNVINNYLV